MGSRDGRAGVKVLDRGNLWPSGEPAMHVEYESGEMRPIHHVRPRRRDCSAVIGAAATMDSSRQFLGLRCPSCRKRIYRVKFPMTATFVGERACEWVHARN